MSTGGRNAPFRKRALPPLIERPRRPVAWMRRRRTFFALLLLGTAQWWLPSIGAYLIVADPLLPADAIVPLAGDPSRVPYAADLLKRGMAHWFVATNMQVPATAVEPFSSIVQRQARLQGVPDQQIVIAPGVATTTYQEALIVRRFVQQQGWHAIIIVTSPSHTRRARQIFRAIFAQTQIAVSVRPVEPHWYTATTWWHSQRGVRETLLEYLKLMAYWIGYHSAEQLPNPALNDFRTKLDHG